MKTYSVRGARTKTTGHLRQDGTRTLWCTRPAGIPNGDFTGLKGWKMCQPCVKAERADRVRAEAVAEQHQEGAAEHAEAQTAARKLTPKMRAVLPAIAAAGSWSARAGLAELPTGVTYPSLQALIRRGLVEEFNKGETATNFQGQQYTVTYHRLSATGHTVLTALAPEPLAETVEQADAEREQPLATVTLLPSPAHRTEVAILTGLAGALVAAQQRAAAAGATSTMTRLSVVRNKSATELAATLRAADAVEYAEQVRAGVETVADAEALYAAALVTEAEATDGTWQGAWIGEQPTDETLFDIEPAAEQGALFAPASPVVCAASREPIIARATFRRDDLDRIKAKDDADRAAYRATTDDRIAAECAAHGVAPSQGVRDRIAARTAEQAPARRVIEGVIVSHNGTTQGSTPTNATHPNVMAARAALDGLAVTAMTDHHDVTEPTEAEQHVRGYLVDPREGARVAVYWLEGGRIVRRDTPLDGAALDCLADRLARHGWTVEKMLRSSQCVFAHRPSTD